MLGFDFPIISWRLLEDADLAAALAGTWQSWWDILFRRDLEWKRQVSIADEVFHGLGWFVVVFRPRVGTKAM